MFEGKILPVDINSEMKKSYIDYAMSVIVGRALPDVRDGLKPVHRRILYSMHELGLTPEKGYRKCARIVGDVLGKYHPHGDTAVYDALVRMAQDFNMRYTLVDGHGNFGSVDGDSAAAMRYTEAKMSKINLQMLRDINKDTVDFIPNFDGEEKEPCVLPARFPNLLVNGSAGIAVGMATNIPPHNLNEVIDGIIMLIDNPEITIADLMTCIKGPDFPTAGIIKGVSGIKKAYETGRGKIILRAKASIEEVHGRNSIIVTEIPYQVNKSKLIENIADLVKNKKIEGIHDLRDESDREGMRIVIELKKDVNPNVTLNRLYKHTKLQDTFGVIMLALVNGEPKILNLKQVLVEYIKFQEEVITRRTQFNLNKSKSRAHILEGLKIALDNIDEVMNIIRASKSVQEAKNNLIGKFNLSEKQSQAILDMKFQRLTGLERKKIEDEYLELQESIKKLVEILSNREILLGLIKSELIEIKEKYGDERRTAIEKDALEVDIEDLIQEKNVVVTVTKDGYVKRVPEDVYTAQRRGGRGIQALATKENDLVEQMIVTSTHNNLIFFTNLGRAYKLKGYEIPEAGRTAKGINIINLIPLDADERIQAIIAIKDIQDNKYLLMSTKKGIIKKTTLSQYANIRKNGLIAINLRDKDELIDVKLTNGQNEVIIVTKNGYGIRFSEKDVRPMGRNASGVKAINLREDDIAVAMNIINEDEDLLVVSENGFGKRTPISEYRVTKRGAKGVITYKITDKTGCLVAAKMVNDSDEIMLINSKDIVIRINVSDISVTSRNAMGVTLMKTGEEIQVVAVSKVNFIDSDDIDEDVEENQDIEKEETEDLETQENVDVENVKENNEEENTQENDDLKED